MNDRTLADKLIAMSPVDRAALVASFARELTIRARETYRAGTDEVIDAPRLRAFNEAQHRLITQVVHQIHGHAEALGHEDLAELLIAYADELGCIGALESARRMSEAA